jgi:hypothetical protein
LFAISVWKSWPKALRASGSAGFHPESSTIGRFKPRASDDRGDVADVGRHAQKS